MLKRTVQKCLARLRASMQVEIIAEIRLLRGELRQLGIEHEGLRVTLGQQHAMLDRQHAMLDQQQAMLDRLHGEQEQLHQILARLHGEQDALAATLDRVALLDQTARSVEDGLLSLTLLRKQEADTTKE
jgi:hypothetical protein